MFFGIVLYSCLFCCCFVMVVDGRRSSAFLAVRGELEPVEVKVPRGFSSEEWGVLSYEDRLDFVRRKKDAVLAGLQAKLGSPVVSLICDWQDFETRMEGQAIKDGESGVEFSDEYLRAMKLKIELAKAIKSLLDKGVVKHEHVVKRLGDDEVLDVDFEAVVKDAVLEGEVGGDGGD